MPFTFQDPHITPGDLTQKIEIRVMHAGSNMYEIYKRDVSTPYTLQGVNFEACTNNLVRVGSSPNHSDIQLLNLTFHFRKPFQNQY